METVIKWNEFYSVGINQIDDDHKKLLVMLNKLNESIKTQEENETVRKVLTELVDYTEYHFQTEEKLFAEHAYPDADKHIAEHQKFTKNILQFRQQYAQMKQCSGKYILDFLKNWLIKHILASDKAYSDFLTQKGVS